MTIHVKPYAERTPDFQYQNLLKTVLENGVRSRAPQGVDTFSVVAPPPLRFDLENGSPVITERRIGFWRQPIGEICAFINGVDTVKGLEEFGCHYWKSWGNSPYATEMGLAPGELGPGSYGPAFHDFPMPPKNADEIISRLRDLVLDATDFSHGDRFEAVKEACLLLESFRPKTFDQFKHLVEQIRELPYLKTHVVTPWIPYYTVRGEGKKRRVVVAPCHGWIFVNILGDTLYLMMHQRSADVPVGVPSNFIQYSALALMLAHLTGYRRAVYIHSFFDAHLYENQIPWIGEILSRPPRPFPTLSLTEEGRRVTDIHDFRHEHFTLSDYNPHPAISGIPVAP